jgi:predicted ribosomally synthesized peptide with SipW-like signal peptide
MSKKIKKVVLPVGALTLVGAIGALTASQLAYLTDEETAYNTFTIGDVKVDLQEPNYPGNNSDEVSHIIPNQEIDKDPQMNNSGTDSAVVFAQYSIPVKQVTLIADDGTPATAKTYEELFTTLHNDTVDDTGDTIGSGKKDADWIQVTDPVYATEDGTIICKVEDATEEQKAQQPMNDKTLSYTKEHPPGHT